MLGVTFSTAPTLTSKADLIQKIAAGGLITTDLSPSATLVPGAGALPSSIGSKLTIRNVVIGAAVAAAGYLAYAMLVPPKKGGSKPATASPVTAVAGLFGYRPRRRRR